MTRTTDGDQVGSVPLDYPVRYRIHRPLTGVEHYVRKERWQQRADLFFAYLITAVAAGLCLLLGVGAI